MTDVEALLLSFSLCSIARPELGAIYSLLDGLRSLFQANNFLDPTLREFGW